jgi:hypothetical protein
MLHLVRRQGIDANLPWLVTQLCFRRAQDTPLLSSICALWAHCSCLHSPYRQSGQEFQNPKTPKAAWVSRGGLPIPVG